jgi:hypothetical protein
VHGATGDALRALFLELAADEQPLLRLGALMAGTDAGARASDAHPLVGAFVTDRLLHVAHEDPRFAGMLHRGRPLLLDLADRADLGQLAGEWGCRVDVVSAATAQRPADALLILPDARIAWAATVDEAGGAALLGLREALTTWLGAPCTSVAAIGSAVLR